LKYKDPKILPEEKSFASQIEANLDYFKLNSPPRVDEPTIYEQSITKLIQSQGTLKVKIDSLDKEHSLYQQDIGNLNWTSVPLKGSYPITKEI